MKKILIIGKRGFIGKSLNKFLKTKHDVKLISFKEALNFKQIYKYISRAQLSINNLKNMYIYEYFKS